MKNPSSRCSGARNWIGAVVALVCGLTARAGLVAYYPFNTGPADASGHGYDGTLSLTPPTLTTGGGGYEGEAYVFNPLNNGANNYLTVGINLNQSVLPRVTFGAWVNTSVAAAGSSTIRGIISHDNGSFDRTLGLDTRGGGGLRYSAFTGTGVFAGATVVGGSWTFLALRYDQSLNTLSLDVGGSRTSHATSFTDGGLTTLTIGRNPGYDQPFSGLIDNVFVYDEWLSDATLDDIRIRGGAAILEVPEPGTAALLSALGLLGFGALRRRSSR